MVGEFSYFLISFNILFYVSYVVRRGEDVMIVDEVIVG